MPDVKLSDTGHANRRFTPYPEYEDSGVEWLGKIPAHWEAKRLKHLASLNPDSLGEDTDPSLEMIFTAELKNPLTGQDVEDAIRQYMTDRDPREPLLAYGRCLAHFAVDPDLVYVATELAGPRTRFLPFNQGKFGGAGNPPVPPTQTGYATSYLWEETWARDSVLDLVRQFIHEVEEHDGRGRRTGKRFLIFPRYDKKKAQYLLKSFVELHPHAIGEKVKITVEHFAAQVQGEIGGKAKAMIVTRSRLHAVRYKRAVEKYLAERGYPFKALVTFSGTVRDGGQSYTESGMNGFPEAQTARTFERPEYRFLIVANKFQTGFDQPLLHAM